MYPCLWLKVPAEYNNSCARVGKETPVLLVFLYAFCEGIHAQVTSQGGRGCSFETIHRQTMSEHQFCRLSQYCVHFGELPECTRVA